MKMSYPHLRLSTRTGHPVTPFLTGIGFLSGLVVFLWGSFIDFPLTQATANGADSLPVSMDAETSPLLFQTGNDDQEEPEQPRGRSRRSRSNRRGESAESPSPDNDSASEELTDDSQNADQPLPEESGNEGNEDGQGERNFARGRGPRRERTRIVPFDEAMENAGPTDQIPVNQPDLCVTADQVYLKAIYYKGNADKSTTPVILLHDFNGKKEDMIPIAEKLAAKGMAVLLPDLRGCGESVTALIEDYSAGGNRPFIRENEYLIAHFNETDFDGMKNYDGLLWFQFLVGLHNDGKLNIRQLVILGNGLSASIAANWIQNDWQNPSAKRGHFTKGLLMISPMEDPIFKAMASGRAKPGAVVYQIFVGSLNKEKFEDAKSIGLEIGNDKESTPEEDRKVKIESFKTDKQGIDLTEVSSFAIPDKIIESIESIVKAVASKSKWQPIKHFMEEDR